MQEPRAAYAICATPRTGGQYLDALLRDAGIGNPREWLFERTIEAYCREWRVEPCDYLAELWRRETANGTFGIRVHWAHRDAHPGAAALISDWNEILPPAVPHIWVFLYREALEDQARSLLTAARTGQWGATRAPYLNLSAERVELQARTFARQNADWTRWFDGNGLTRLEVRSEDLFEQPGSVVAEIRALLGG